MNHHSIPRRTLLKGASAALALTALRSTGLSAYAIKAQSYKVALIGTGWYGKSDLFRLMQVASVQVVALCDVDKNQLAEAAKMISARTQQKQTPKLYNDYKMLLAETKPDIVLIGTPDHWHALTAIEAMKSGAHVYVQKPVSVDVREGEAMVAAARKYNRIVQVGMQRRSTPHLIEAKKRIVEAGLLGKISSVEMCCYYHMRDSSNPPLQPVPSFLNYDAWTGPAPLRPYDGLLHGRWRNFMEYGNGIMGDMGVHMLDATRWMLGLGWPKRISSTGGIYVQKEARADTPDTQTALFEYDELNCTWQHRTWGTPGDADYPWSFKLHGEKGTLKADVYKYDFIPEGKGEKIHGDVVYEKKKYPEDLTEPRIELHTAPATRAHMLNFLHAIENNTKPVSDIEEGYISTSCCILANLSMQLGRPLVYDSLKREITGDVEATALLQRKYRDGYVHPLFTNI